MTGVQDGVAEGCATGVTPPADPALTDGAAASVAGLAGCRIVRTPKRVFGALTGSCG